MKKLYLHIGTPKTGTTSIQHFFQQNEDALSSKGIYFPSTGLSLGHRAFRLSGHSDLVHWLEEDKEESLSLLLDEMDRLPEKTKIVLSSERFFLHPQLASKVAVFFKDFDVRIVCYIRRPDRFLESLYREFVVSGWDKLVLTPEQFVQEKLGDLCRYDDMLAPWAEAFGAGSVVVKPFEPQAWPNGNLLEDFLLAIDEVWDDSYFPVEHEYMNVSPSAELVQLVRVLNGVPLSRPTYRNLIKELLEKELAVCPRMKDWPLLSEGLRREILDGTSESVEIVAKKYMGKKDGRAFADRSSPQDPAPVEHDELQPELGFMLLSGFLKYRARQVDQELNELRFSARQVDQELNELRSRLGQLTGSLSGLRERDDSLQESLVKHRRELDGLAGSLSGLRGRDDSVRESLANHRRELDDLTGSLSGLRGRDDSVRESLANHRRELDDLTGSLSGLHGRDDSFQKSLANHRRELDDLKAALSSLHARDDSLHGSLANHRRELDEISSILRVEVGKIVDDVSAMSSRLEALEDVQEDNGRKIQAIQDEIRQSLEETRSKSLNMRGDFEGVVLAMYEIRRRSKWFFWARRLRERRERKEIVRSGLFDSEYYRKEYLDGSDALDPILHYIRIGVYQGASPTVGFDTAGYISCNCEVLQSGENPFVHYIRHHG